MVRTIEVKYNQQVYRFRNSVSEITKITRQAPPGLLRTIFWWLEEETTKAFPNQRTR